MTQFVEHVDFSPGEGTAGVDRGEQGIQVPYLCDRQQEHPLLFQAIHRADRARGAAARPAISGSTSADSTR